MNLPALMNGAGELEENVNLQRRDLRHCLGGLQQIVFCDGLKSVIAGRVQINSLDKFHVVEERAERHEVRKANFVPFGHLKGMSEL